MTTETRGYSIDCSLCEQPVKAMAKVTFEGQVTCLCESHYYRWLDRMRAARVVVRVTN